MKKLLFISVTAIFISGIALTSYAQVIVSGKGPQQICYEKALYGNSGTKAAIQSCNEGLERALSSKDKAATYVNRGILYMRKSEYNAARADYENAIATNPNLPEAYMNYGAVLIHLNENDAALEALNTAINDFDSQHLHQALYNRAIIYDRKDNFRDAYLDLKRALELRPDWEDAKTAITRYKVVTKTAS